MNEIARSLVFMGGMVVFCLSVLGAGLFLVWLFFRVLERFSERGYASPRAAARDRPPVSEGR